MKHKLKLTPMKPTPIETRKVSTSEGDVLISSKKGKITLKVPNHWTGLNYKNFVSNYKEYINELKSLTLKTL